MRILINNPKIIALQSSGSFASNSQSKQQTKSHQNSNNLVVIGSQDNTQVIKSSE